MKTDLVGNPHLLVLVTQHLKIAAHTFYAWLTAPVYPHIVFLGPPWPVPRYINIFFLLLFVGSILAVTLSHGFTRAETNEVQSAPQTGVERQQRS